MGKSEKFEFYLPSRDGEDLADVNQISENFRIIDEWVFGKWETIDTIKSFQNNILRYLNYEITENNTVIIRYATSTISGNHIIPDMIEGYVVKEIKNNAFLECLELESIVISESVTNIGEFAFQNCRGLVNVKILGDIQAIKGGTFDGCSSLKTISLPKSITSIGEYCFDGCVSLTDVYYSGTEEEWNNIEILANNEPLKNATIHYQGYATTEYVDKKIGDIETALDRIIEIQKELIGVINFKIGGSEFQAERGMTWGEWCESEYNTTEYEVDAEHTKIYYISDNVLYSIKDPDTEQKVLPQDVIRDNTIYIKTGLNLGGTSE